jgi:hypothetical protein
MTTHTTATIDACMFPEERHEPHSRMSMWPEPGQPAKPLWCLGYYDQQRQNRRVVIATADDGTETLVGEGLTVVGSAWRDIREPGECGECGECRHPEDFDWDPIRWENDAPVITCHVHGALAPGWAYDDDIEVGTLAYRNAERIRGASEVPC